MYGNSESVYETHQTAYTCMLPYTKSFMHTCLHKTHTRAHTQTHTHMCAHTHTDIHVRTHTQMRVRTHTHAHTHTLIHSHTYSPSPSLSLSTRRLTLPTAFSVLNTKRTAIYSPMQSTPFICIAKPLSQIQCGNSLMTTQLWEQLAPSQTLVCTRRVKKSKLFTV